MKAFETIKLTEENKDSQDFSFNPIDLCIFLIVGEKCNFLRSMGPKLSNAEDSLVRSASTIFLNTITIY